MAHKDSTQTEYHVTTSQISEILGLSKRRVQQLVKEDALVRVGHGKFDLKSSIPAYLEYQIEKADSDYVLDKNTEEALWTRARREKKNSK